MRWPTRIRDVLKWGLIYYASMAAYLAVMTSGTASHLGWFLGPFFIGGIIAYAIPCLFIVPPLMAAKIISIRQQRMMGLDR